MRAWLVLFLCISPLCGQENFKRHIDNTEENKTLPKLGPPLRRYTETPLSNRLVASVSGNVAKGNAVTLVAAVRSGRILNCTWTSPQGAFYNLEHEFMSIAQGNVITSIQSNITSADHCQLALSAIRAEDFGTWKCRVHHSENENFQDVYISVSPNGKSSNVRLPRHVRPQRYSLFLTPFIVEGNFTIEGHVDIDITVLENQSRNITLHINEIEVYENYVKVLDEDGNNLDIIGYGYDKGRDFFIIYFEKELPQGQNVTLSIDFLGQLSADLDGFYRSSYFDEETKRTEYLAATQFEAVDARRALPCFDEPALRAVFQVNLGRVKDMSSISNMPADRQSVDMSDNDEYVWDMYQDSPYMPTYLLAFVVSKFTYRESPVGSNGVQFRIWSRKSMLDQTKLAADVGPKILEFFERHYNVPYPLPKMDMIALPDFGAGAMENWGLITYRETALLYKDGVSGVADKEGIISTIAHELAHQWFGNLVTMNWWTDLWLNEGFAHYMQYLGAYYGHDNDTAVIDKFVIKGVQRALEKDSLSTSHPVSVPVNHPSEISEIFDSISYNKGGSLIRMMANFLGVENFNKGIEHYLKKHQYGNAVQDDLWQALTEVAHQTGSLDKSMTIKEIMDTWTLKMGYPVISVNRTDEALTVSQKRFIFADEINLKDAEKDYSWWVPVSYTTPKNGFENTKNSFWMSPEDLKMEIHLNQTLDEDEPLVINVQQTGFYRVNYDEKNWKKIASALVNDHQKIHRTNRAQILEDSLTLARAGLLDYAIALGNTEYLDQETDYIPWSAVLGEFGYIGRMLSRTSGYGVYKAFVKKQLEPIFKHLGFENKIDDQDSDIRLRSYVISTLCDVGHVECEQMSIRFFANSKNRNFAEHDSLPVDIRGTAYCTAISKGTSDDWNHMLQRYLSDTDSPSEKRNILNALGCSNEIWILQKLLDMSVNNTSGIRKQDSRTVIYSVANNDIGRDLTWNWLRANWNKIYTYYESGGVSSAGRILSYFSSTFNKQFELKELEDFYNLKSNELGSGQRAAEGSIQKTKANVEWMGNHYNTIVEWLERKVNSI